MPDLISCGLYKQGRSRSAAQRKGCGSTMGPTPKTLKHEWIFEPCLAPRMMILQHSNFLLCREWEINRGTAWLSSNGIISASTQRAGNTRNKQQVQRLPRLLTFPRFPESYQTCVTRGYLRLCPANWSAHWWRGKIFSSLFSFFFASSTTDLLVTLAGPL